MRYDAGEVITAMVTPFNEKKLITKRLNSWHISLLIPVQTPFL